jgi:hypothetical protein
MEGTAETAMDIPYISVQRTDKFSLRSAICCSCCPFTPASGYYGYRNMKAKGRRSLGRNQANSPDPSDPVAIFLDPTSYLRRRKKKNLRLMTLLIWQRMSNHKWDMEHVVDEYHKPKAITRISLRKMN